MSRSDVDNGDWWDNAINARGTLLPRTPEEAEYQFFGKFNAEGSRLYLEDSGDLGLVDSWRVVRIAQHADSAGLDLWVGWRALGWHVDPSPQYSHVVRIVAYEKTLDDLRLTTERGDHLRVEFLSDLDSIAAFARVRAVQVAAPDVWRQADTAQVQIWRDMANAW